MVKRCVDYDAAKGVAGLCRPVGITGRGFSKIFTLSRAVSKAARFLFFSRNRAGQDFYRNIYIFIFVRKKEKIKKIGMR